MNSQPQLTPLTQKFVAIGGNITSLSKHSSYLTGFYNAAHQHLLEAATINHQSQITGCLLETEVEQEGGDPSYAHSLRYFGNNKSLSPAKTHRRSAKWTLLCIVCTGVWDVVLISAVALSFPLNTAPEADFFFFSFHCECHV